jgi:hypothetical protein
LAAHCQFSLEKPHVSCDQVCSYWLTDLTGASTTPKLSRGEADTSPSFGRPAPNAEGCFMLLRNIECLDGNYSGAVCTQEAFGTLPYRSHWSPQQKRLAARSSFSLAKPLHVFLGRFCLGAGCGTSGAQRTIQFVYMSFATRLPTKRLS